MEKGGIGRDGRVQMHGERMDGEGRDGEGKDRPAHFLVASAACVYST